MQTTVETPCVRCENGSDECVCDAEEINTDPIKKLQDECFLKAQEDLKKNINSIKIKINSEAFKKSAQEEIKKMCDRENINTSKTSTINDRFPVPSQETIRKRTYAIDAMFKTLGNFPHASEDDINKASRDAVFLAMKAAVPDNVRDMKASDMRAKVIAGVVEDIKASAYMMDGCELKVPDSMFKGVKKEALEILVSDGFIATEIDLQVKHVHHSIKLSW